MLRFPYFLSFLIFFFAFISASQAVQPETIRVSIDYNGNESNSDSSFASISGNGRYIAFTSYASNLVSEDTNGSSDIFVHDRQTGETTRVSVDSSGNQANWDSYRPAISDNGRYVAFQSYATNLVNGDTTSGKTDVFVHDRQTGETTRVSVDSNGNEANNFSQNASISSEGRYVAFRSYASNLVYNDTNGDVDVFVHDMLTGETTIVSVDSSGNQANEGVFTCIISNDGRYVTFDTYADNLVSGDTNEMSDIFVHDRQTGETTRVSVNSNGNQSNGNSEFPDISINGRYVAFQSYANNLVNGDTNGRWDIFIHDLQTGKTTRVSVDSSGNESNSDSSFASISSDGNYVAFSSYASNLVSEDTNGWDDIFVHDRQTGKTTRVSVDSLGNESNYACYMPSISSDGIYVAFESWANNLVIDDTNGNIDVFVRGPLFDADNDGVSDAIDNCPTIPNADQADSNSNGIGDICDTSSDSDSDGITDADEVGIYNTSPTNPDTDSDGLYDGVEVAYWGEGWNSNPDGDQLVNLLDSDSDNDGLSDGIEVNILGTNPALTDTDGNGTLDGDEDFDLDGLTNAEEIQCSSDPLDSSSKCFKGLPFLMLLLD